MITDGFTFLALLLLIAGGLKMAEQYRLVRFLDYVPAIVLLYFTVMVLSTLGLWERSDDINNIYRETKTSLLPAMIFLMLLKSDLRRIRKLGPKLLTGFFSAALSIMIGFVVSFSIFHPWLESDSWQTFAALGGSWMGGTGNMAAIQGALNIPESKMGYTLLIDSIDYAIWVVLLLALVPYSIGFNRWVKADPGLLDDIGGKLQQQGSEDRRRVSVAEMLLLLGISLLVSAVVQSLAEFLPTTPFLTHTTWVVLIVTVGGVAAASTRLGRMGGSEEISTIMLYTIVALIASRADFSDLTQAPTYILAGLVILLIHAILLTIAAKLFKLDLFTCGIASLANIGGVASAPILAAAYSSALIPVGILMAMLGYIIGTGGGLLIGRILSGIG